jgi:hypothetical protein
MTDERSAFERLLKGKPENKTEEKVEEIMVANITLTGMVKWMNDNFSKDGIQIKNEFFTSSDIQQYIRVGHIPFYMGGHKIVKVEHDYAKLYNIIKDSNKDQ